jgi:hypothetical protein
MEMPGDQVAGAQEGVRRPTMAVKDPHAVPDHARGRIHPYLPRQMRRDPYVVVAENEVHRDSLFEEAGEEVEHDGS